MKCILFNVYTSYLYNKPTGRAVNGQIWSDRTAFSAFIELVSAVGYPQL